MEPRKPTCKTHGKSIEMVCLECKKYLCVSCTGPHFKDGCKGGVVDLPFYAMEDLLKQFPKALEKLEADKQKIEDSAREFTSALPEIGKKIRTIKGQAEKLAADLDKILVALEGYGPDSAGTAYIVMKEELEHQIKELPSAVKTENIDQIMKAISSTQKSMADSELQLSKAALASVNKVLLGTNEFDTMSDCLQRLAATCHSVLTRKFGVEVMNRFVYGVCNPMADCKKLCRYDIVTRKITPRVDVPQNCAVLQMGKRIFISGGFNPLANTLQEFTEETQSLVIKKQMNYAKYCHTVVAISETQFMTIGGSNSSNLSYCEEYSIPDNTWKLIPPLNQARYGAAATLSGAYLYVIGGNGGGNVIERIDMKEKKVWDKVALSGAAEVPLRDYSAAFSISTDEIMFFVGGSTTKGSWCAE